MALTLTAKDYQVEGSWDSQGRVLPVPFNPKLMPSGLLEQSIFIGSLDSCMRAECCLRRLLLSHLAFSSLGVIKRVVLSLSSPQTLPLLDYSTTEAEQWQSFPNS